MNNVLRHNYDIRTIDLSDKSKFVVSAMKNENNEFTPISYYEDSVWDFSNKTNNYLFKKTLLKFHSIKFDNNKDISEYPKLMECLKDLTYKLTVSGLKLSTIQSKFMSLIQLFNYTVSEMNKECITELSEDDIKNYIDYLILKNKGNTYSHLKNRTSIIPLLYKFRNEIKYGIKFNPLDNINIKRKSQTNNNIVDNKQTEIIPDLTWKAITTTCFSIIKGFLENKKLIEKINKEKINQIESKDTPSKMNIVFKKIINNEDGYKNLRDYNNYLNEVMIACGIIIQSYTGMRIAELMSLKRNCIVEKNVNIDKIHYNLIKIKGFTFKYTKAVNIQQKEGKEVTWICPDVVQEAIFALEIISEVINFHFEFNLKNNINKEYHKKYNMYKESLFLMPTYSNNGIPILNLVGDKYKNFLLKKGIIIDFKFGSHCFRRTLARFFAKSLIKVPVNALQEQFKHYSKDITYYYMKGNNSVDDSFVELMDEYIDSKRKNDQKNETLLFEKIKNNFDNAITTASNIDELLCIIGDKQIKLVNQYMATTNNNIKPLSPIESLTCDGVIILPSIHLEYWSDLLKMYDEMIEVEPNSQWHKKEQQMIKNIVDSLKQNKAYIVNKKEQL